LNRNYYGYPLWFWSAIAIGILLRISSIWWNDRLLGDINLFALTAREYSESGKLNYPMKYDYSAKTVWGDLRTPQSQHPPLWSYIAGCLAKLFGTKDTYGILQMMSMFAQCLVLWISFKLSKVFGSACTLYALPVIAFSPMLIDFAGNGSQYSLGSFFLIAGCWVLIHKRQPEAKDFLCSGFFCALAFLTHGAFILAILATFACALISGKTPKNKVIYILLSGAGFIASLVPLIWFRLEHFNSPFHNLNSFFIAGVLGKLSMDSGSSGIFWQVEETWHLGDLITYTLNCLKVWKKFVIYLLWEWGPSGLFLGSLPILGLFWKNDRKLLLLLFFLASYLVTILLWPGFKSRFLAPVLPLAMVLSILGYSKLIVREVFLKKLGVGCLAVIFIWFMFSWSISVQINGSPSRYYSFDLKHKNDYAEMKALALDMHGLPKGLVIGAARSLDGGVEGIYWHEFPYIHSRAWVSGEAMDWNLIERIKTDYNARYFWTDDIMLPKYSEYLSKLEPVLESGKFKLFRFIESPDI